MAHTFTNFDFETVGASPGTADGWTSTVVSSLIGVANFGPADVGASPYEGFEEGWLVEVFKTGFETLDLSPASWPSGEATPLFAEGFEREWLTNESWAADLTEVPTEDGEFAGALTAEAFETGWDNTAWAGTLVATTDAVIDGGDHESYDYAFESNGNPLWTGLEEVYETSVAAGVGSSPSNWPLGVEFSNGPDVIILPAGVHDFEDIYLEVGDTIWIRNSDVGDSNGTRAVTSIAGGTLGVDAPWDTPGTATTRVFLSTINNAAFVNHGGGGTPNFAPEHEYFDASDWEVMDTL